MSSILTKLLISFGVIVLVGTIAFLVIFLIHRSTFKKLKMQILRFNTIKGKIYSVNFYRLDVLAQNEMLNPAKFERLKANYQTLKDNCHTIYIDLTTLDEVIKRMNIKEAKRLLAIVDSDLNKTSRELDTFLLEFNKSTQYSDGIEDALQVSIDTFNEIKNFYYKKVVHHTSFKQINKLIDLIQEIINNNADFSSRFDFDSTVKIFSDLHTKIKTLWKAVVEITKLQFIDIYLQTSKHSNDQLIIKSKGPLHYKDVEFIQKANKVYELDYSMFKQAFLDFDLNKAYRYCIKSCQDMAHITKFATINASSELLIETSLSVINDQTNNIINNRDNILKSIDCLSQYFVKNKKTESYFKQLDKDVDEVIALSNQANRLSSHSVGDKIKALKQLQNISSNIAKCKENISENVNKINDTLENIINLLTHLNELYTYHIQMLPTIKVLANDSPVRNAFIALLNNNIKLIQTCVNEIITSEEPNFKEIGNKIISIIEETQQVKSRINSEVILKSYAKKLMLYANRFKKESTLDLFEKAQEEYKSKNYTSCLDTLLAICKKYK